MARKHLPLLVLGFGVWSGCNAILGNEEKRVGSAANGGSSSGDGSDAVAGGGSAGNPSGGIDAAAGLSGGGKSNGGSPSGGSPSGGSLSGGGPSGGGPSGGNAGKGTGGAGGTGVSGSASEGGAAGAGGVPGGAGAEGCNPGAGPVAGDGINLAIDDLEDGNSLFLTAGVGQGLWHFYKDANGGGAVTPSPGAPVPVAGGQTGKALHVTGTGVTGWGAGLAAQLNTEDNSFFDASAYAGVAFYIKGTSQVVEGTNKLLIEVRMPDLLTGPGSCCDDKIVGAECFSAHRKVISISNTWTEVVLKWDQLADPGWGLGSNLPFNPNRIYDILFTFTHDTLAADAGVSFDVWVDGLRFVAK